METREASLTDLIAWCGAENQRLARGLPHDDRACVEIFRRALNRQDADAWAALRADYGPLARTWLESHPLAEGPAEPEAGPAVPVEAIFERFRALVPAAEFEAMARLERLLARLKLAVFATLIETIRAREAEERRSAVESSIEPEEVWRWVEAAVPDAIGRLAVYLVCALDLRPVEIARRNPNHFATSREVARHLLDALDRLGRGENTLMARLGLQASGMAEGECVRPGELDEAALVAYALGERSRRAHEHLLACPRCATLVRRHEAALGALRAALFRFDCPAAAELGKHVQGTLPPAAMTRIGGHLTRCPRCAAEEASAVGFLDVIDRATLAAIPSAVRETEARFVPEESRPPTPRRSATLVYATDDLRLTLHPQAADRPRGQAQVLGFAEQPGAPLSSLAGARVRLLDAGEEVSATTIDDIGSFIVGPAPPGSYTLEVAAGAWRVVTPRLMVMPG